MCPRVLVTDHVFGGLEVEHAVLGPLGAEVLHAPATDEATLTELAGFADAILVCYAQVTRPGGRGCGRRGLQGDRPLRHRLRQRRRGRGRREHGITVTYVPDYCLDEVADHAMALLLLASPAASPQASARRARRRLEGAAVARSTASAAAGWR